MLHHGMMYHGMNMALCITACATAAASSSIIDICQARHSLSAALQLRHHILAQLQSPVILLRSWQWCAMLGVVVTLNHCPEHAAAVACDSLRRKGRGQGLGALLLRGCADDS
jgi:hypothetical protein